MKKIYSSFLKKHVLSLSIRISIFLILALISSAALTAQSPVGANGKLSVSGSSMVNQQGTPIQLRGMSSHGPQWFGECYNFDSMNALTNDWGIDIMRLAMYIEENGYVTAPEYWRGWIDDMVDLCEQFGVYCLIDWHVLTPGDPNANIEDAKVFWDYMSKKHAGKEHVIYEICNEPNGVEWPRVKEYADVIIPIIRANDPNTIIIVGTPNWSQDVDTAADSPIIGDNIMYALHFYSGTHLSWLRDKATTAMNKGIALFVTEFGTSQASGDGGPYLDESDLWMNFMADNKISWCNWSYSAKDEISAALKPGACGSDWNNTSTSGEYIKGKILSPADSWANSGGNIPPVTSITKPDNNSYYEVGDNINISATASDTDGSVSKVEFYANDVKVGEDTTAPYSITWSPSTVNTYTIHSVVTDDANATNSSLKVTTNIVTQIIQDPYPDKNTPASIPGAISAVNYDDGGEGIAYHDDDATNKGVGGIRPDEGVDTEGGDGVGNIGYVITGEWLEYTVNVASTDTYSMVLRFGSEPGGGKFHLEFDEVDKTGLIDVPSSGSWGNYQELTVTGIALEAGIQVMRMYIDAGDFNFSKFSFEGGGTIIPVTSIEITPSTLSLSTDQTSTLSASVLPSNASNKSVTWSSSNTNVVTVSDAGIVNALAIGSATISATSSDPLIKSTCQVTVTESTPNTYTLNVNTVGMGTVESIPTSPSYEAGTEVSLVATPADGYIFTSWSGDISNTNASTVLIMDANKTVTATFTSESTTPGCDFDAPLTTPLPSINNAYNNIHVIGNGPDLSNVSNLTINWDLANNGLWQLSISTTDGSPDWYNNLSGSTQNFNSVSPSITIAGSGFTGLDGTYWATLDGDNFVLVEKSNSYTLYFSNSASDPCLKSAYLSNNTPVFNMYPNPVRSELTIDGLNNSKHIEFINMLGQTVLKQKSHDVKSLKLNINHLSPGAYIVVVTLSDGSKLTKSLYIK